MAQPDKRFADLLPNLQQVTCHFGFSIITQTWHLKDKQRVVDGAEIVDVVHEELNPLVAGFRDMKFVPPYLAPGADGIKISEVQMSLHGELIPLRLLLGGQLDPIDYSPIIAIIESRLIVKKS